MRLTYLQQKRVHSCKAKREKLKRIGVEHEKEKY